jgi:hypothetical protein
MSDLCTCNFVQGPGIPKVSKVAGPFRALWNLVGVLTLLMGLSAAWLVGSQALRSAAAGNLGVGSTVMTTSAAATPSAAASSSAGAIWLGGGSGDWLRKRGGEGWRCSGDSLRRRGGEREGGGTKGGRGTSKVCSVTVPDSFQGLSSLRSMAGPATWGGGGC